MLKKNLKKYYFLLCTITVVFFFFLGEKGAILTKDSLVYIGQGGSPSAGYVIYPAFVRLMITLFGENSGLECVWLTQSILASIISICTTEWIRKRFGLSNWLSVLVLGFSFLPYTYTLPEYVATHEIMTEGIAISLFNVMVILLLKWHMDRDNKVWIMINLLLVGLFFLRPQLLTICVAVICIYLLMWLGERKSSTRKSIYCLICVTIIVVAFNIKPIMLQVMEAMPQFNYAVSGKVLLTIEESDRDYFTGIEQEAFDYVYSKIDQEKDRMEYLEDKFSKGDEIMASINNNTKYYISYFKEFCDYKEAESQVDIWENELREKVVNTLFINNFGRYVKVIYRLLPYSLVASVFIQPEVIKGLCYVITAMIYAISITLWILAKKRKVSEIYTRPYKITMVILLINALLTNTVFYAQQRYVIYTFGWFYISIALLMYGLKVEK